MGKKATKAADNMYYLARCEAAETNVDFSSREKAAELVGIDRTRLAISSLDPASRHRRIRCSFSVSVSAA